MKKLLCLLCCALLLSAAVAACADELPEDLMEQIYLANLPGTVSANHESQLLRIREKDASDSLWYDGYDGTVFQSSTVYDGTLIMTPDYAYVLRDDGKFERFISFISIFDPWDALNGDVANEELVSVEEQDDTLVVTSIPVGSESYEYYEEDYPTRFIRVVDAQTLELISEDTVVTLPDGTEETCRAIAVERDVEMPCADVKAAIEAHLSEADALRTTTFVLNADLPTEYRLTYTTPVGDGCSVFLPQADGVSYGFDMERSTPSNDARDNDAIYYVIPPEE